MYSSMLADGCNIAALREARRVLSTALNEAVARELVGRNVAHRARLPRARPAEIEPLTVEEARKVLAVADDLPNGTSWAIHLALGLRRSELLGLHWDDVDLDAGTLTVRRTVEKRAYGHGCLDPVLCTFQHHTATCAPNCARHAHLCPHRTGGVIFTAPKSIASYGTIALPDSVRAALIHHRDTMERKRQREHAAGLVFHNGRGAPIDPARHTRAWHELLDAAGVRRIRLHDARHTAATFLLMLGVDQRTTMTVMGWAHAEVSERYQHVVTPIRRDTARRINELLWPSKVMA
jgi:integrase